MIYGIKYYLTTKGKLMAKDCTNEFYASLGSNGNLNAYFTNKVSALRLAAKLTYAHKYINYEVFNLTKEQAKNIDKTNIFDNFDDFKNTLKGKRFYVKNVVGCDYSK